MPFKSFADAIHTPQSITEDMLNGGDDFYGWPLRRLLEEYSGLSTDSVLPSPSVRPGIVVHNVRKPIRRATLGDIAAISNYRVSRNCTHRDDPTGGKVKWREVEDAAHWLLLCESLLEHYQQDCRNSDFFRGVNSFFPVSDDFYKLDHDPTGLSKKRREDLRYYMSKSLLTILLYIVEFLPITLKESPLLNSNPDKPNIRVRLCIGGRPQNPDYEENGTATGAIASFFKLAYTRLLQKENGLKLLLDIPKNEQILPFNRLRDWMKESAVNEDEKKEAIRLLQDDSPSQSFVIDHTTSPLDKLLSNTIRDKELADPSPYPFSKKQRHLKDHVFRACLCHELFLQIQEEAHKLPTIMGQKQP
jgi:hypothetical protein